MEGKRACRVRYVMDDGGWRDEAKWPAIITASTFLYVSDRQLLVPATTAPDVHLDRDGRRAVRCLALQ